jgi:hypothetical protein
MSKPREWWISEAAYTEPPVEEGFIHVIEKRAYDAMKKAAESWQSDCEACWKDRADVYHVACKSKTQIDALKVCCEKLVAALKEECCCPDDILFAERPIFCDPCEAIIAHERRMLDVERS